MDILQPDHSAHWYEISGSPRHRVPYADKKRKDETRPATLKDARLNGWCPSVTSILKIIDKEALTLWRVEQAVMAALTLPQEQGEVTDQFAKRVVEDMKVQTRRAADRGQKLHRAAENWLGNRFICLEPELERIFQPVREWLEEEVQEVIMTEQVLVHREEQYAGTVDLIAVLKSFGPMVVDIKTQGYKDKPTYYAEWGLQLEAYRCAYLHSYPKASHVGLLSLVVSSEEAKPVQTHQWPEVATQGRIDAFNHAHGLWRWIKQYPKPTLEPLEQF